MVEKSKKPFSKGKSGKFGGGGEKTGRGGFSKKFEGDRKSSDRKPRSAAGAGGFKSKRDFGDRPARGRDGDSDRKPRSYGDRPKRDFGDRPKRDFGDRPRRDRDEGFGERKPRSFGDRPKRDFGDRPRRDRDEGFGERKPRSFGDRPKRDFGDRPKRDFGDRPRRDRDEGFGERKPRSFGDRPKRDFGDRPKRDFGDKPKRDFGDKKPRSTRTFDDSPRGDKKTFQRNFDRKRPEKRHLDIDAMPRHAEEASAETRSKLKSGRPNYGGPSPTFLYGHHAVRAALLNPKRLVQRLMVTEESFEQVREAYEQAQSQGLRRPEPVYVEKEDIERLLPRDSVHQDVLLDSQQPEDVFLTDIINAADDNAKVIVLDQVTDPHNVGAILRTAAAFGAIAVIAQKLHAPDITGTLAKTASGAAEVVPIVRETNLSRALEQLKNAGFTCLGLDERGKRSIAQVKAKGKVALVMGAEGDGLRRLVAENCDELVKLPTSGPIASLNVSNATAVALYELIRK